MNDKLEERLINIVIGVLITTVFTAPLSCAQERRNHKDTKDEAVKRGFAEYVTDGRVIKFTWKEPTK